jgi:hypothetical protein
MMELHILVSYFVSYTRHYSFCMFVAHLDGTMQRCDRYYYSNDEHI